MDDKNQEKVEKSDVAKREEEILEFWNKNRIFEKSEEKSAPSGDFVFYDGPPFATGLPHYGHLLGGTIKDVIPRYKTMQGYSVRRTWGWDCHGLPIENIVEKELGLSTKKDIEKLGIGVFNQKAHDSVMTYADYWKKVVPRMGRWVHMDSDYKTMDATYTESVWWAFKTLSDKGLVKEGFKAMHLCPRCGTTLSNFEVAQGYEDIIDFAVTVKLELVDEPGTFLLAWTTTPWTLPGNMAAAVHKDATYVKISVKDQTGSLILAKDRLEILSDEYQIEDEFKGSKLVGKSYKPPFPYYVEKELSGKENAWKVYHADYVTMDDGTGLVHLAPAFGAEDMDLAQKNNIPLVHHVDTNGQFTNDVTDFAGQYVKPKDNHQVTDIEIIKHLAHAGLLFKKEKIEHSYPHCWRCNTPLLNYASSSWFVTVPDIKSKLISENQKINWVPGDIKDGRFGKWLEGVRDWAVSRSRYWGAPLPVWKDAVTGETIIIGSIKEMKEYIPSSGNSYYVMRHGQSVSNAEGVISSKKENNHPLTEKGKGQVASAVQELVSEKIDVIIASPFMRTKETAEITAGVLRVSPSDIVYDERIGEINLSTLNEKPISAYGEFAGTYEERFEKTPEGGENLVDVKKRAGEFLYDIEEQYKGKKILIITHEYVSWMMTAIAEGYTRRQAIDAKIGHDDFIKNAEVKKLDFVPLPHNDQYDIELHRPYIDDVVLEKEGNTLKRIEDVFDCWFESGSMPYAQVHYPFENKEIFNPESSLFKKSVGYPADFVAEGLDQTRGWFYSSLVLGVGLFGKSPYKNVVVNGTILAEDGKKMSKSLRNYPDPMELADKFGVDALRFYLLSSPVVRGEDMHFSEKGVAEIMRKNIGRLSNVLTFYNLYKTECEHDGLPTGDHVLDKWILERLNELTSSVTNSMEVYELDRATRPIADFIDDLSTWYLRRSRDRFKGEDTMDKVESLKTTNFVLKELSKIIAPFMPFFAEYLYLEVTNGMYKESVHLEDWPSSRKVNDSLLKDMKNVRHIVTLGLEARDKVNIKVRQPLSKLSLKKSDKELGSELLALIKDEVNVKSVEYVEMDEDVVVDSELTKDLIEEGGYRDLIRYIQELRKKENLEPQDIVVLEVETNNIGKDLINKREKDFKNIASLREISFVNNLEVEELKIGENTFKIKIVK